MNVKRNLFLLFAAMAILAGCKKDDDRISIDITSKEVSGYGDTVVVNVQANVLWYVISDKTWATPTLTSSSGNETVSIGIAPNSTGKQDQAVLTFKAGKAFATLTIYRNIIMGVVYNIGDLYPDSENPMGMVYEITDWGLHGKIISLDEAQSSIWGRISPSYATNMDDGTINWQTIIAANPTLNKVPAFAWCSRYGANWTWQLWYLPAYNELLAISKNARNISSYLQNISGAVPLKDNIYWSSTESASDSNRAYAISIFSSSTYERDKDSLCSVRAISTF